MFISYAQNFEDVLLWRALKHVKKGFYIDVGAQDPNIDSVSRAFYEQGWRGVHVEPIAHYARMLRAARPDEDVIEAAIATTEGDIPFFDIPDTGLSTGKANVAEKHRLGGFQTNQIEVASMRLATLLDRYGTRDIHWLKIDVEEMERDVLESWTPSTVRPWIVALESTVPQSSENNSSEWEPIILSMDYEFAHFDGLNRFYVHASRKQLKSSLHLSPNVFDDFAVGSGSPYAYKLNAVIADLSHRLEEVFASTSWRVTAPLRGVKTAVAAALSSPRAGARSLLERMMRWVAVRPGLRSVLRHVIRMVPPIERRLQAFSRARDNIASTPPTRWAIEPDPVALREWEALLNVPRRRRSR